MRQARPKRSRPKGSAGGNPQTAAEPPRSGRILVVLSAAVIVLAAVAAYWNSFQGVMLLDDEYVIRHGDRSHHLWRGWETFRSVSALVYFTFAVNHRLGGLDPWGYHAVNLAIHILAALTLLGIVRRTLLSGPLRRRFAPHACVLALATALLWALHPIQTESVTYLCQRLESLMGLMYLLTLYCVIRGAQSRGAAWWWYGAAAFACLLGMHCKGVMMTAPVIVLLYDRMFLAGSFKQALRRRWPLHLLLALTWSFLLLNLWHRFVTEGMGTWLNVIDVRVSPWTYAATQFGVILHYLRLSFWPSGLCLDYAWQPATKAIEIVPPATAILALLGATLWGLWRNRPWSFPGVWFFFILAPTSSFLTINELAFEHRMYLPLAGIVALLVVGARLLGGVLSARRGGRPAVHAAGVGLLVLLTALLAFLTRERNRDYRSRRAMWEDAAGIRPDNPGIHLNLGSALLDGGDPDAAAACFSKAIDLRPKWAEAHFNRASACCQAGRYEQAVADYTRVIELQPDNALALHNRGFAWAGLGRYEQAARDYTKAIGLCPGYTRAYVSRSAAYERLGRIHDAISDCTKAIELDASCAEAYGNRAACRHRVRAYAEAWSDLEKCRKLGGTPNPMLVELLREATGRGQ
jgi:Flp pilus assembly protein TadD